MLDITTIENALYDWVSEVTGVTTIFAHPNAPRPQESYVLINLFQVTPMMVAEHKNTLLGDYSTDVDYSTLEELSVSINTYYAGSFQLATKLKDSLSRVTIRETLFDAGVGYGRATSIQEIPEEINKRWEERAQFDCFFYTRSLDEENIETIQHIQVKNELDGDIVTIPALVKQLWIDVPSQLWVDVNNQTWIDS
jgi:hypothetical protein